MKYLVSVAPETVTEQDKDKWAASGEPVIPWFPAPPENVFVSVTSHKKSPYAKVVDVPNLVLDKLFNDLRTYYPGLPIGLLENYVLETAKVALRFEIGTNLQVTISTSSAKVYPVGKIEHSYTMWDKQPFGTVA